MTPFTATSTRQLTLYGANPWAKVSSPLLYPSGAFGNVKLCRLRKDKTKQFAIKAMKKNDIIQSKHVDHIENEKKILEQIAHPFIVSTPFADTPR